MRKVRKWLPGWLVPALLGAVLLAQSPSRAEEAAVKAKTAAAKAAEARLLNDISVLASDEYEGRGPTTRGLERAADYIANEFKKAGLKPGGTDGTYFQPFTIPGARKLGPASITLQGPKGQVVELKEGVHFHVSGLSGKGAYKDISAAFAGYSITGSEKFDYDDYTAIDAGGKVVFILRDTPRAGNRYVDIDGPRRRVHASLNQKIRNAEKHGALAVFFLNDADTASGGDQVLDFDFLAASRGLKQLPNIPVFHVRRSVLEKMLSASGEPTLPRLEADIDRMMKPQSRALDGWGVSLSANVERGTLDVKNVIGVLEGKGPLANETVVVGAHYDHLGYGSAGSLARLKKMVIHNGADDNASGTSAIMELARRFAQDPQRQGRRLVFMAFSVEEMGLLGSRYYCKHPIFPLEDTVAMVNLDMVGRLDKDAKTGKEKLQVHGVGTAKTFEALIDKHNKEYGFQLQKVKSGFGPSDHSSFYEKKVPVFFFFTGDHPDYHRPGDDTEKINLDGLRRITDMVEGLTAHMASAKGRPEYVEVKGGRGGPRPRLTLGFRPEYGDDKEGVLIGAVTPGGNAAKAGAKDGDRIIEMDGEKIKNLQGYMIFMAKQKEDSTINVVVMRDGKKVNLKVKLEK